MPSGGAVFMPSSEISTRGQGVIKCYKDLSEHLFTPEEKEFAANELEGNSTFLELGPLNHAITTLQVRHRLSEGRLRKWRSKLRQGNLNFGSPFGNPKGGAFEMLDGIAKNDIRKSVESAEISMTKEETNIAIVNGIRSTIGRRNLSLPEWKQIKDLPREVSTYVQKWARRRLNLVDRKPEYLTTARKEGQEDPETTLNWAFLCEAFSGDLAASDKSNCDGSTLTITTKGTDVSVTVTREGAVEFAVLSPSPLF